MLYPCGRRRRGKQGSRKDDAGGNVPMSTAPEKAIEAFVTLPEVVEITTQGTAKASVRIQDEGLQADIRVVSPESYGAALQYFTGSKSHNVEMRKVAQKKGWKLSEYGLFDGEKHLAGKIEEEIYKALGMKMPPPEERKNE